MKALLTAFALLSFVAASTLPLTASAEDMKGDQNAPKSDTSMSDKGKTDTVNKPVANSKPTKTVHHKTVHKTPHKKTVKHKPVHHKHVAKKTKTHKDDKKSPAPKAG